MDLQDAHIGIQVHDLTEACALLTELFGLTFAEPISGWPIRVRVGDHVEHSEGTFAVSRQGPPYLEVTENVAGSQVWHTPTDDRWHFTTWGSGWTTRTAPANGSRPPGIRSKPAVWTRADGTGTRTTT